MRTGIILSDGDYATRTDGPRLVILLRTERELLLQLDTATHKGILNVVPCLAMMTSDENGVISNYSLGRNGPTSQTWFG